MDSTLKALLGVSRGVHLPRRPEILWLYSQPTSHSAPMQPAFSRILLTLTLIWTTLVACVPPGAPDAFNCDDLIDAHVASLDFGQMTSADFESWASQMYSVKAEDFVHTGRSDVGRDIYKGYVWTVEHRDFRAIFVHDRLIEIEISSDILHPSGTEITECLGAPQFYFSTFTTNQIAILDIALFFPHRGIKVHRSEVLESIFLPPNLLIDGDRRLKSTTVSYTIPTDIEQQLQTLYNPLDEPKMHQNLVDFRETLSPGLHGSRCR